jgi:hypothetical protein
MTIASPCVVTLNAHGYAAGDPIKFGTTGALPTGVNTTDFFYVIASGLTANTFRFSTSPGGAARNTSGSQSGTHSVWLDWDKHVGGVSIKGGDGWVSTLVEDNMIYGQDTSCIFIKNDFGSVTDVTVNHNKMMGEPGKTGPGYMLQAGDSGPSGTVTDIVITNNFMEAGSFGHLDYNGTTNPTVASNNWSYTLNRYLLPNE